MSQYGDELAAARARFLKKSARAQIGGNVSNLIPIPGPEQPPAGVAPGLFPQPQPRPRNTDFRKLAILALLRGRMFKGGGVPSNRPLRPPGLALGRQPGATGLPGYVPRGLPGRLPGIPERPQGMQY